jgi:dephospho-CoA kinase
MVKVGVTGGIASGKSTVCEAFARLGAEVLDVDKIAREVVQPGQPGWEKLRQTFGPEFFNPDGFLNRARLRELIFADPERRRQLNEIVHPEVMREVRRRSEEMAATATGSILVVDVPLLLEVGAAGDFDQVVVVYAAEEVQVRRLMQRDGLSPDEARQALAAQMPLREKVVQADVVIDNSGSLDRTQREVEAVWKKLLLAAEPRTNR